MKRDRLGLTVVALSLGACLLGDSESVATQAPFWLSPIPARHAGTIAALGANESTNWSGYNQGLLEKGELFTAVSGQWNVPAASQRVPGRAENSSAWVGIGGGCLEASCLLIDPTLIQAGTNSDVDADGTPHYSTWWEIIPLPQITTPLQVTPGNQVRVDISQALPEIWTITITNLSTPSQPPFSITVPYPSAYGTAEWIVETPTVIGTDSVGTASMPNLAKVTFSNAQANGVSPGLVADEAIVLCAGKQVIAAPSVPPGSNSFSVSTYPGGSCS